MFRSTLILTVLCMGCTQEVPPSSAFASADAQDSKDTATPKADTAPSCQATSCDDGNPCTDDACDTQTGLCSHLDNVTPCEDGSACTVGDTCAKGSCAAGKTKDCDDGNACTTDACDAVLGCQSVNNVAPCDADGSACTVNDACSAGVCVPGPAPFCKDGNPCTDDGCDPSKGCAFTPNDKLSCSDDDACTVGDLCKAGKCKAGVEALCGDDGNPCTDTVCDAKEGCQTKPNVLPCDDGNPCSTGDVCEGGTCAGLGLKDCDDNNECTGDSCDPKVGCVFKNLTLGCSDGNLCTVGDACKVGVCVPGGPKCADGNACTDDACNAQTGACFFANNTASCDKDGSVCTADACKGGACVLGSAKVCDDGNDCTTDACDPVSGACVFTPMALAASCGTNKACFSGNVCKAIPNGMILIPGGSAFIGCSPQDADCIAQWGGVGSVQVTKPFLITKDEFAPHVTTGDAALAACKSYTYDRLPTAIEWEKAARGGCEMYPGQDCAAATHFSPMTTGAEYVFCVEGDASCKSLISVVSPGGTNAKDVSPYGVRDMAANSTEWVSSDAGYVIKGFSAAMIASGTKWAASPRSARTFSYTQSFDLGNGSQTVWLQARGGFRCARDL